MNWPNKVWEMGKLSEDGRQLWYSRLVTPANTLRRREYELEYIKRQKERLAP